MKKYLFVICLFVGTFARSEVYSFDFNDLYEAMKGYNGKVLPSGGVDVTLNGVEWHIEMEKFFDKSEKIYVKLQLDPDGERYYAVRFQEDFEHIVFTTTHFAEQEIKSLEVNAGNEMEISIKMSINGGADMSVPRNSASSQPVTVAIADQVTPLSIDYTFTDEALSWGYTDFFFQTLSIEYVSGNEPPVIPVSPLTPSLAVEPGTKLDIVAEDGAAIYYSINGDDYELYEPDYGISVPDGGYTLSYYAEANGVKSDTVSLALVPSATQPYLTVAEAVARHTSVTVRGVVCGRDSQATYIEEEAASYAATDEAPARLAVDHSGIEAIQSASLGTLIEVTGKISDKFGMPSISSVTGATVDGVATSITLTTAKSAPAPEGYYNLKGQRLASPSTAEPYIRRGANGTHLFLR